MENEPDALQPTVDQSRVPHRLRPNLSLCGRTRRSRFAAAGTPRSCGRTWSRRTRTQTSSEMPGPPALPPTWRLGPNTASMPQRPHPRLSNYDGTVSRIDVG